jgi:predicted MPP superfamily phosphohydrolase
MQFRSNQTPVGAGRWGFMRRLFDPSALTGSYLLCGAQTCRVERAEITVPHLPPAFDGVTIAFLADTHHGPCVPLSYLQRVVEMTNALRPDIVALGGDYVHRHRGYWLGSGNASYIAPGIGALGALRAPLGRFAVLGNHDRLESVRESRRALADNGLTELTNRGVWLERGGARLRICGIDDYRTGRPSLVGALGDALPTDAVILLSHNPDFVERIRPRLVSLVLSGHTHGGQIVLPFVGARVIPSRYGRKYCQGLIQGPGTQVFVTRGVGLIMPPVRFRCPPEVAFITLRVPSAPS